MKKCMTLIVAIVAVSSSTFAANAFKDDPNRIITLKGGAKVRSGDLDKMMEEVHLEESGGDIRKPNTAKGVLVVLNAQSIVPLKEFQQEVVSGIDEHIHVQMDFRTSDADLCCKNVKDEIGKAGGVLGVAVVKRDDLPTLLTAPESGWAIVNVAALSADNPKQPVLVSRVTKEVLRAFAFISGGAYLARAPFVMRDVKTPHDLDMIPSAAFGFEVASHIRKSSGFYGLIPWYQTTYLRACNEGWAPAPTNKYQKGVWDKVHQLPTNPLPLTKPTK